MSFFQTTHGRTGPQCEALVHTQREQEVVHIEEMAHEEDKSLTRMWVSRISKTVEYYWVLYQITDAHEFMAPCQEYIR